MTDLMFFSACFRGIMIICPHPQHLSLKSIPTRRTSHSYEPHGWGFFIFSLSPICISILRIFPIILPIMMSVAQTGRHRKAYPAFRSGLCQEAAVCTGTHIRFVKRSFSVGQSGINLLSVFHNGAGIILCRYRTKGFRKFR